MADKRILLLDGPALAAYSWRGGHVTPEGEFNPDPVGLEAFAAYLKKHRSSLFHLLADIAEEGFQVEDLPYVQGADRDALLQRRLSQYYYNTPLATAISLGRARDGRRDEKVLFAALTRIDAFTPWLEALREAEAILAGVYSVPLVAAGYATQLLATNNPVLLVTLTSGGVRQSFFSDGKLHFSRLSQLATHTLDEMGRTCAGDAAKIYQYLVAQRQIPRGIPLRALILALDAQVPELKQHCTDTNDLHFEFVDLAAAAKKLGLKGRATDSNADTLFMHCLATRPPAQQFAPAAERRFHRLWQIRFALTSAAWVVLAGCLLFAAKTGLSVYQVRDVIETTRTVTTADTQRYNSILDGLPKINISPENLRAVMGRIEALRQRMPAMEPLLVHLSLALSENPRIELNRLTWQLSDRPDAGQKAAESSKPAAAATQTPPPAGAGAGGWTVVEIQAQLPLGLVSDQRAQMEMIEGFASRLRDATTDVRILSRPFDIESDKPLKSTGDRGEVQPSDVPKFSLRLARRL